MGGQVSNLFGKKPKEDEQEENLRRYQEEIDAGGSFIGDEADKQKVKWWERLLFDKRFRITYVVILACILGLFVPIIIFATELETRSRPIYGSCLIIHDARFECLPNSPEPVTEDQCTDALCCWENNEDLPYKCYHSFPSAYQYNVSKTTIHGPPGGNETSSKIYSEAETWTELDVRASHPDLMSPLRVITHWESREHLVVEMFNAEVFPERHNATRISGQENEIGQNDDLPFAISWGEDETLFFIRIGRRDTNETIFDTRLGPVYCSEKDITLATLLPTQYFYGLKGGQGSGSTITYPIINGFESAEYPFYISFEVSGQWHGVLIDTFQPMLAQVVHAPGLMLHMETTKPEMNLHFFPGPTQPQVLEQLHKYIRTKHQIEQAPYIPPYWGLGMHLCRNLDNGDLVLEHLKQIIPPDNPLNLLVYDSDCIDEHFRHPLYTDYDAFNETVVEEILSLLEKTSDCEPPCTNANLFKRILLTQKSTLSTISSQNQQYFEGLLVQDTSNSSDVKPFEGEVANLTVNYIDYFNPNFEQSGSYPPLPLKPNGESFPHHGFTLDDNFPQLDNSNSELYCPIPETRLQAYFTMDMQTTSTNFMNASYLWGSLCPQATAHLLDEDYQSHMSLHNVYGEQALKIVHKTVTERQSQQPENTMLVTSGSYWTASLYYGAFHGMTAPFTWKGLQESVAYTVRNYGLAPVSGTHICGALLGNNVTFPRNNELCLRWFQFGLLLPFARNTYDEMSSYGPNHLPGQFLSYLNETIRTRYTFAPYYYTQLRKYQATYVPMIRPMSFDFNSPKDRNGTLPILDQFMVGDAMFAAPILERGVGRTVYFPAGLWYAMDGMVARDDEDTGEQKPITGHLTETPMFIRGGYMIPTLQNPEGLTIEDSLRGNYTLLTAVSSDKDNGNPRTAQGSLIVKVPTSDLDHLVDFSASVTMNEGLVTVNIIVNGTCADPTDNDPNISTRIDQVRIFGLSFLGAVDITVRTDSTSHSSGEYRYFGESDALRIYNLNMDWCTSPDYEVIIKQKGDGETTTVIPRTTKSEITTTNE